MRKQPSGEAFHHRGSVLARPESLTTMAVRSTPEMVVWAWPPAHAPWFCDVSVAFSMFRKTSDAGSSIDKALAAISCQKGP